MKVRARTQKVRPASSGQGTQTTQVGLSGLSDAGLSDAVHARISALAYRLYEQRGRVDGYHLEDWIQAEHTILTGKS